MQRLALRGVKQNARDESTTYTVHRVDSEGAIIPDQTVTDYLEFAEMTAPDAPATNGVRLFAKDNGSGKTQICARFPTGAVVQLGIEP